MALSRAAAVRRRTKIRVIARARPNGGATPCVLLVSDSVVEVAGGAANATQKALGNVATTTEKYTLDGVIADTNEKVYDDYVRPLCEAFYGDAKNVTVFCYGMTGSGKTHTLGTKTGLTEQGNVEQGIIQRFAAHAFAMLDRGMSDTYEMTVQLVEIYNNDIYDLIGESQGDATPAPRRKRQTLGGSMATPRAPRRSESGGVSVTAQGVLLNARSAIVTTAEAFCAKIDVALGGRRTAATAMNDTSSRSHAVVLVKLRRKVGNVVYESEARFVDLAGSERLKKTLATGDRQKEGTEINKALSVLNRVIKGLSEGTPRKHIRGTMRESRLTQVVQQGLGGDSLTLLITCVSAKVDDRAQTVETLSWATRARKIECDAKSHVR